MRIGIKLLLFSFIFISLTYPVFPDPIIANLTIEPQNIWLGESSIISVFCSNGNSTIDSVYAKVIGPEIIIPFIELSGYGNLYNMTLDEFYLDRTGQFNLTVFCQSGNQTSNESANIIVSELKGYLNGINPNPSYIGDVIDIYMLVKKDDTTIASGVNFTISLDGQQKQTKINPIYDTNKGWVLKIDSPLIPGIYELKVSSAYNRASIISYSQIEVREELGFDIKSIDRTWVKPDDFIYIVLNAMDRGSVIDINEANLKIEIGSSTAEIEAITKSGNDFSIKLKMPHNPPGSYDLKATLVYKNNSLVAKKKIDYVLEVKGKFTDSNDKALSVTLKFLLDGYEKLNIITDAAGSYSGSIPLGTYDIHIIFPKSTLILEGAYVDEFDDPISYSRLTGIATPGIINHALYIYEVAIPFENAEIEIRYNDVDENDLKLFKCSNWNSGNKLCNNEWKETDADIDTVRNVVEFDTETLSAFALGSEDKLTLSLTIEKSNYGLKEPIIIKGVSQDSKGYIISNVSIEAGIANTNIIKRTLTDNNGVFSLEIIGPEKEGKYKIYIIADKDPYLRYETIKDIIIEKSLSLSLLFPDSVKLKPGENVTQEIKLVNTGQSDIEDLKIEITGIEEKYYTLDTLTGNLLAGKEKTLFIRFSVPDDTADGTEAATIRVSGSNNLSREKTFGFTIEPKTSNQENLNQTASITGFAIDIPLPQIDETAYVIIFAIISFSTAFVLKARKKNSNRTEIKNTLYDIKNHLKTSETKIIPVSFPNIDDFKMNDEYRYG